MWTSVYMTQNIDTARYVRELLEHKQIPTMFHLIRTKDGAGEDCYEILVPGAELSEALDIIVEQ